MRFCDVLQDLSLVSVSTPDQDVSRCQLPRPRICTRGFLVIDGLGNDHEFVRRVGAHIIEFVSRWVTSELVSILTSCTRLYTAFQNATHRCLRAQERYRSARDCVIRGQVAFMGLFWSSVLSASSCHRLKGRPGTVSLLSS